MGSKEYGKEAEIQAVEYLESIGFTIIERNFFAKRFGEIDIVAMKDKVIHFIEVKGSRGSFEPIYNITPSKLSRVINSANYYMRVKRLDAPFCIDALIIYKDKVELIENITI